MVLFSSVKPLVLFACAGVAISATGLGAMDLQTLVDRSPFAPPAAAEASQPEEQPGTLEFRGLVVDEAGTAYSVFDASANRGYWVREGEAAGPIRITSFKAEDGVLEVEQNGKPVQLALKRATITNGAAVALAPAPSSPQGGRVRAPLRATRIGAQAAVAGPDRMAKIAEEVRQRRAARLAAQTGGKKADAPATPLPTPGF